MSAAIRLRTDLLQTPLVRFVRASALHDCTVVEETDYALVIRPRWPVEGWSAGERILWALLTSLAAGELHEAFDRLDTRNLGALCDVFAYMQDVVA